MIHIAPLQRERTKDLKAVFEIAEAVMGFVPNSMLIMARDPDLLAAFAQLSAIVVVRPGRIDPGLKALIMYVVSRSAGCQYCVAHSANLAASHDIPVRKVQEVWQYETSPEFNEAERAALRFAQAAGQVPNTVTGGKTAGRIPVSPRKFLAFALDADKRFAALPGDLAPLDSFWLSILQVKNDA